MSYSISAGTQPIHSVLQNFCKETTIYRGTTEYNTGTSGGDGFCLPRHNKFCHIYSFFPLGHPDTECHELTTYLQASSPSLILLNFCCNCFKTSCIHPISLDYSIRILQSEISHYKISIAISIITTTTTVYIYKFPSPAQPPVFQYSNIPDSHKYQFAFQ